MSKRKELLAAGYIRDILFQKIDDCKSYLHNLDQRKAEYKILDTYIRDDNSVIIRILQQYNNAPLIQLYEED